MTERPSEPDVGRRLRALRQRRGLTQRALAQACAMSANAIGLIERGECSPSVSTLYRLCLALEAPITALFTQVEERLVVLTRQRSRTPGSAAAPRPSKMGFGWRTWPRGCLVREWSLFSSPWNRALAPAPSRLYTLARSLLSVSKAGSSTASPIESTSWIYKLEAGDSLIFLAHQPHCWCNIDDRPARLLVVFHAAEGSQKWWRQHLSQQTAADRAGPANSE